MCFCLFLKSRYNDAAEERKESTTKKRRSSSGNKLRKTVYDFRSSKPVLRWLNEHTPLDQKERISAICREVG
jgi:hypothetical protein